MTQPSGDNGSPAGPVPFISRVRLKNYKSIASCDVRLGPLTILVGPNGSGKSNFLDALAFLARALETTPSEALNERGGMGEVVRRVPSPMDSFRIRLEVAVPQRARLQPLGVGSYEVEISRGDRSGERGFEISYERYIHRAWGDVEGFRVDRGVVHDEAEGLFVGLLEEEPIELDRLFLPIDGRRRSFARLLFNALRAMPFYSFALDELRQPQRPLARATLGAKGEHLGDVLGALEDEGAGFKERLDSYLRAIVPGAVGIDRWVAGPRVTVKLRSGTGLESRDVIFGPDAMSDGTVRAAAVLAALFQPAVRDGRVRLIGIEEPEIALHPAAAGVIFDALTEASEHVQVIATSQSADLLDREDLDLSTIRPVTMRDGQTVIGEVDDASREIAEKKLYTLGELMRGNQLTPKQAQTGGAAPEET
jgi:predicted ATPase